MEHRIDVTAITGEQRLIILLRYFAAGIGITESAIAEKLYEMLDIIENFVAYLERPGGLVKAVDRNHQVLGVNASIENLI